MNRRKVDDHARPCVTIAGRSARSRRTTGNRFRSNARCHSWSVSTTKPPADRPRDARRSSAVDRSREPISRCRSDLATRSSQRRSLLLARCELVDVLPAPRDVIPRRSTAHSAGARFSSALTAQGWSVFGERQHSFGTWAPLLLLVSLSGSLISFNRLLLPPCPQVILLADRLGASVDNLSAARSMRHPTIRDHGRLCHV